MQHNGQTFDPSLQVPTMTHGERRSTRFANRKTSRIAYDPGVETGTEARCAVLLHDLLADRRVWRPVAERVSAGFRLIAIDLRGHGASAMLANQWYSVRELAADLTAILDSEHVERADLVGHGLGATVALEFARLFPDKLRTIVLIEPYAPGLVARVATETTSVAPVWRASDRQAADAAYKGLIDRSLDLYLTPRLGPNWRDALTSAQAATIRRHAGALVALLPAIDAFEPSTDELASISSRALLIAGSGASNVDHMMVSSIAGALTDARTVYLSRSLYGATPFEGEAAAEVADNLLRFWSETVETS